MLGSSVPITLTLSPPPTAAAFAILGVGYEDIAPFELTAIAPGSMIWIAPAAFLPPMSIPATGTVTISQFLPPIPGLAGLPFHAQWIVLLSGGQLATSDGLRITIGS